MALHEAPAVDQLVADHTVGEQGSAVFSAVQQPTGIDDPEEQLHIAKALFSELLPELVYDATQEQPLAREFVERVEGVFGHVGEELRSEEHTSELQSRENLVCRLLLEKKNNNSEYELNL